MIHSAVELVISSSSDPRLKMEPEESEDQDGSRQLTIGHHQSSPLVNSQRIPLDHACSVCGAPASAHHHYGAIVCYPCRAFFRRGTTKNFQCRTGNFSCPLEQDVKNRCRGCRYEKCLSSGMKPEMVDATLLRKAGHGGVDVVKRKKGKRGIGQDDRKDGPLDLSSGGANAADASTQLFYVFNPPTQTYEPITIISLGEEEEGTIITTTTTGHPSTTAGLNTNEVLFCATNNDILTDHEEIVQTECEDSKQQQQQQQHLIVGQEEVIVGTSEVIVGNSLEIEREEVVGLNSR